MAFRSGDRYYSWERRRVFFDAIVGGASFVEAAAVVGAASSACQRWWQASGMKLKMGPGGGLRLVPPAGDSWTGDKLTALGRDKIATGLAAGVSQADIARGLGRCRSKVSREVRRNSGQDGSSYGSVARAQAYERARRAKPFKLDGRLDLVERITIWLDDGWSPRLIAAMLAKEADGDKTLQVSHETIYQTLYVQARGHLRADLYRALSTGRARRRSRTETRRPVGPYVDALKISERPAEIEDRAVPGHWEGDLILGADGRSAIGTLVERKTRFAILLYLPGDHTAETVSKGACQVFCVSGFWLMVS